MITHSQLIITHKLQIHIILYCTRLMENNFSKFVKCKFYDSHKTLFNYSNKSILNSKGICFWCNLCSICFNLF